jgi:antitoxin component of RelBE/YafQ-DinJ toxin-antitoxin module
MSTVISVRIPREVKEILEEGGVDVSREVRVFLEELAWKIKLRRQIEKWDGLLAGVKPSREGFAVESVREDREGH